MNHRRSHLTSLIMIPLACLAAFPFYYIFVNTFKSQEETAHHPFSLPSKLYFGNYANVFENTELVRTFINTLYVTSFSVLLMLVVGSMAAFGRLVGTGRTSKILGIFLIIAFLIPGQATLIPLYRMLNSVRMVDSLNGLVVIYSTGSIFCYYLILGYMRTLPSELLEAARIDGAGPFLIYRKIVLPLIRPILITVGVFQTMWVWNDFIYPNVLISSPQKGTLVLQVYAAVGQFVTDWPAFMTLTVIVLFPMLILFILMQRHIISGFMQGSIKG